MGDVTQGNLVLSTQLIMQIGLTVKISKGEALSISNSIALTKGYCLKHQILNSLQWLIYIINSVDNTKSPCSARNKR